MRIICNFAAVNKVFQRKIAINMEGNISKERAAYLERARKLREAIDRGEKISPLERAKRLGPVFQLVPGFSFDSDSQVKLYG
ncbi:MAG: hypothetical protein IJ647_06825 [Prevotella sp.]|nr:hypothetical protein [Prevotella sp.]